MDDLPLPVKPSDWVSDGARIATVKDVYYYEETILVDLYMWDYSGLKMGRISPVEGGPRTFEPACPYEGWFRITAPEFPIRLTWQPTSDGKVTATYFTGKKVSDRQWIRPKRGRVLLPPAPLGNFDPNEIMALRRAAQELRDMAKKITWGDVPLIARAEQLEKEADALSAHL